MYAESNTAPTAAGKYKALITISGVKTSEGVNKSVTASVDYEIGEAQISIDNSEVVLNTAPLFYSGSSLTPIIKTIGGMTLDPETDYIVTYAPADTQVTEKKGLQQRKNQPLYQ